MDGPGYFDLSPLNLTVVGGQTYFFFLTNVSDRDFRIGRSSDLYAQGTGLVNGVPWDLDLAFKIVVSP